MTKLAVIMKTLKANEELCSLLANGKKGIYHLKSPSAGTYPILILSIISDVPHIRYDNSETISRQTLRVHIITSNGASDSIETELLKSLNYIEDEENGIILNISRKSTFEHIEDKQFVKTIDFSIV